MRNIAIAIVVAVTATGIIATSFGLPQEEKPTPAVTAAEPELVVVLVRHAEKASEGRDPELTSVGESRAAELARVIADLRIEKIHSTPYLRTRGTAAPLAKAAELEVATYDPRDLEGFAKKLVKEGGRHLVVGHSNTTPELFEHLGLRLEADFDETFRYDRLLIVTRRGEGKPIGLELRYGEASTAQQK